MRLIKSIRQLFAWSDIAVKKRENANAGKPFFNVNNFNFYCLLKVTHMSE